jgi:hypothetical protein
MRIKLKISRNTCLSSGGTQEVVQELLEFLERLHNDNGIIFLVGVLIKCCYGRLINYGYLIKLRK